MIRSLRGLGLVALLSLPLVPAPAAAQEAEEKEVEEEDAVEAADESEAVLAIVERLFDGMRAADTTMVRSVFHPGARLVATGMREGGPVVALVPVDRFVASIGEPREEVWDEKIWDSEVRIDGNLATVWTPYAFYRGTELSHCGTDAFQLARTASGWRIVQVADTRRREGCLVPDGLEAGR